MRHFLLILSVLPSAWYGLPENAFDNNRMDLDNTQNVLLKCEGIKSETGYLMVAIFDKESNFLGKEMFKAEKIPVSTKGEITVRIILPKGTFAAAVYHDVNGNGKLDRNLFYYPTEAYGFSNNARGIAGPPSWNDAKFTVENDLELRIMLQ